MDYMGTIILYHGTGADDFSLAGEPLDRESLHELLSNARRVLSVREHSAALKLLEEIPFSIYPATNHFDDQFHVLYAEISLERYESYRRSQTILHPAARHLVEAVAEVDGPYIRFVALGLAKLKPTDQEGEWQWDLFISYASEDRSEVAEPLAKLLGSCGLKVWYDKNELKLGDSLRQKIDEGLARCRYGVVILSPSFFQKHYPSRELNGLAQREVEGRIVILPIWHRVTR